MWDIKTIDRILKDSNINLHELARLKEMWICNGCWGKWGLNFSENLEALPYFNSDKKQNLLWDMRTVCDIHDRDFYRGEWFIDFIKANWRGWNNLIQLFHWTSSLRRLIIFLGFFLGTSILGWKYFRK